MNSEPRDCPTCNGTGDGDRCPCMDKGPQYDDAGNPDHDGSPRECQDCYQGRLPCRDCQGMGRR